MIPLNATAVTTAHAQHQHEAATRTPHQLADADTDAECKPITATGCLDPSLADMYSVFGASARTDTSARPPRRPALSVQTVAHCLCGEELCGFDCHFLQQEFQEFAAAELRRRRHRRHRRRQDQSKELTTNSAAVGGSDADSESNCSSDDCDCENDGDDDALTDLERRFHRHYSDARSTVGFSTSFAAPALFGDAASVTGGDSCGDNGDDTLCPPARMNMRRSKSCGVHSSEFDQEQLVQRHNAYRLRIGYRDEALRERSERNTQALLQRAMVGGRGGTVSTATILARKALRYRKVLERMEGVDVTDPSLDVSKCLGVHWQRVGSPEQ